jgi:hypothetical protein
VGDRISSERAIPVPGCSANVFETVKPNVFTLELLLDGDIVAEFSIVFRSSAIVQGDNYAGV